MTVILVTGVPGSGKSSVAEELCRLGYTAVDADEDEKLSGWENIESDVRPSETLFDWFQGHRWAWNASRIEQLADLNRGRTIFICGSANNLDDLLGRFSQVLALEIDVETLAQRLDQIDQANGFSSGDGDTRDQIRSWLPHQQQHFRELGAVMIDGKRPIDEVVHSILEATNSRERSL